MPLLKIYPYLKKYFELKTNTTTQIITTVILDFNKMTAVLQLLSITLAKEKEFFIVHEECDFPYMS